MRRIPTLNLSTSLPKNTDVVVVGLTETSGEAMMIGAVPELGSSSTALLDMAHSLDAKHELESVTVLPQAKTRVVVVGLGDAVVTPDAVRRAAGAAIRRVTSLQDADSLHVAVSFELDEPELAQAAAEGALLGSYAIAKITRQAQSTPISEISILGTASKAMRRAVETATTVATSVIQVRDWVNAPGNLLYPQSFAEQAREFLKGEKIEVEILDEDSLRTGGYGGLTAVGGGSIRPPRLVRMSYSPRGATVHLALVGKGITFDTGGVDLKPAGQMAGMKSDMSGAATVIAAIRAVAALGLRIRITGYACLAENMPSGSAYRSADVLTMFDGQTVENVNTDAEGRLVLADGIARAGTDEPDLIVDVATLTGACQVALGTRISGLMASDEVTADQVLDAAEAAGEPLWHLPITDDIRDQLRSEIADFRSSGKNRWGGALVAGAFLQRFVPDGICWAHLDIAGPAMNEGSPYGYIPTGGTGVMLRTLVALATNLSS